MKTKPATTHQLPIKWSAEDYAALTKQAEKERRTKTEIVKHALRLYLDGE